MSLHLQSAYEAGQLAAVDVYGVKQAGWLASGAQMLGKGMKWLGRGLGVVPVAGQAANAALSGGGQLISSLASGHGAKETLARTGAQMGASLLPGPGGMVGGMAADKAMDHVFAPPAGPQPESMPGLSGGGHLPGMTQ